MKRILLVLALAAGGCASAPFVRSFLTPDGKQAYVVNCSEQGMSVCYDEARKACGGNYSVMDKVDGTYIATNPGTGVFSAADLRLYAVCEKQINQPSK